MAGAAAHAPDAAVPACPRLAAVGLPAVHRDDAGRCGHGVCREDRQQRGSPRRLPHRAGGEPHVAAAVDLPAVILHLLRRVARHFAQCNDKPCRMS